ncbi:MAG: 7-cyano-7-deazaguanine synthase [Pirellulaceae bacterium]|jgi:7-cyano-7-deazaguanine synthase|nr:7-cyano-7-deazaguanine synthase [Pirellulaceae bacterium]MDP6556719.1 7-cyano-7-deazaguanine synthase [Pirellulaceae bacterium]
MKSTNSTSTTGVLFSGGLDSSILITYLLETGCKVQPLYIRSGLRWEEAESAAARDYLRAIRSADLHDLVVLDVPVNDLYGDHWSLSNATAPDAESADIEVYLPGRNALLIVKAGIWCKLNGVPRLALASLGTSPFTDATEKFFQPLQTALNCGLERPLEIGRPFARYDKQAVMAMGSNFPLEKTYSCIAPVGYRHCGSCNKCAERQTAFRSIQLPDFTSYVQDPVDTIPAI